LSYGPILVFCPIYIFRWYRFSKHILSAYQSLKVRLSRIYHKATDPPKICKADLNYIIFKADLKLRLRIVFTSFIFPLILDLGSDSKTLTAEKLIKKEVIYIWFKV